MEFEKSKKIIFRPTHTGETGSGKGNKNIFKVGLSCPFQAIIITESFKFVMKFACPLQLLFNLNEPRREKTGFCICENKDADQLRGNREADQRLCFRCTDSTIPLLPKSEISSL